MKELTRKRSRTARDRQNPNLTSMNGRAQQSDAFLQQYSIQLDHRSRLFSRPIWHDIARASNWSEHTRWRFSFSYLHPSLFVNDPHGISPFILMLSESSSRAMHSISFTRQKSGFQFSVDFTILQNLCVQFLNTDLINSFLSRREIVTLANASSWLAVSSSERWCVL